MSEIQVDIVSRSEVIEGLGLRRHRDVRRLQTTEEDFRRKVQSHTGLGENVKVREIQGGRITEKRHLQQGGTLDLPNLHREETDNRSHGQAESATIRLLHHPKGDAHKVLLRLAVIITCLLGVETAAAGRALIPETDDLRRSTERFRLADRRPPEYGQARKVNLHQ